MPTIAGNVFGSQRLSVVMGMIVTGWAGGYLMVCLNNLMDCLDKKKKKILILSVNRVRQLPDICWRRMGERVRGWRHTDRPSSMPVRWLLARLDVWL